MDSSLKMWWFSVMILTAQCGFSIADNDIEYQDLEDSVLTTTRNANTSFQINLNTFDSIQECILESPDNQVFQVLPTNEYNVSIDNLSGIFSVCGVRITDMQLTLQGNWILRTSVKPLGSDVRHYQQTWKVIIEEPIEASPSTSISSYVGEDIYIQLKLPIDVKSCSFKHIPESFNETEFNKNTGIIIRENCTFILKQAIKNFNGLWEFRGIGEYTVVSKVSINVKEYPKVNTDLISLLYNFPTTLVMGPKEAIFCKAIDPMGREHKYNGQCSIDIERVSYNHGGPWRVYVGLENAIQTTEYVYYTSVSGSSNAPHPDYIIDTVELSNDKKFLNMKCTLMTEMKTCRMIRNDGTTFIMAQGIGNGRYSYNGNGVYKDKDGNPISECGIKVQDPSVEDLERWQCIIVNSDNIEIGKILVPSSGNVGNDTGTQIPPSQTNVRTHRGNALELSCNHYEKIDYCWFLSPNKTIYSVTKGFKNSEYESIGDMALGSCAIKINDARNEHQGTWRCNMGVANAVDSQRAIMVTVHDSLAISFYKNYYLSRKPTIGCATYDNSPVEYCRFIRPDGVGINTREVSESYVSSTDLLKGICYLSLRTPKQYDIGIWKCVLKPYDGREHSDTLQVHNDWYNYYSNGTSTGTILSFIFYITIAIGLACVIISLVIRTNVGKKCIHRVRESIRKNRSPNI